MLKINFKMYEIKNMKDALSKLIEKEMPINAAFRLNKFIKVVDEHLNDIEEHRIKLINKYGKEDKEKNQIEVPPENMADFSNEINALLNEETEIEFVPIDISMFGDDLRLSTKDLMSIEKLIK
jgi:hypothetical protein